MSPLERRNESSLGKISAMAVAMIQTNNSHPKGVESFRHLTVETASKRVLMQTSLVSDIEISLLIEFYF